MATVILASPAAERSVRENDAAKSPVLRAMLQSGMRESHERKISLPWLKNARSLRAVARWLAQDHPDIDQDTPCDVLVDLVHASDFLLLDELMTQAARLLAAQAHIFAEPDCLATLGRRATLCVLLHAPPSQLLLFEEFLNHSPFWTSRERRQVLRHAWQHSNVSRESLLVHKLQRDLQADSHGTPFVRAQLAHLKELCLRRTRLSGDRVSQILSQARKCKALDLSSNEWNATDLMRVLPFIFRHADPIGKNASSAKKHLGHARRPTPPLSRTSTTSMITDRAGTIVCQQHSPRARRSPLRSTIPSSPIALRLANVGVGHRGIQALCEFAACVRGAEPALASQTQYCERLDLSDNPCMGDIAVCKLAESMSEASVRIADLCLDRNARLDDKALCALAKAIRSTNCAGLELEKLSLQHLQGCDMSAFLIRLYGPCAPSEQTPNLIVLDVAYADSCLNTAAMESLFARPSIRLQKLVMSGNRLDAQAGASLCQALAGGKAPSLRSLELASMHLSRTTIDQLCATSFAIEHLDVARNAMSCAATARFSQILSICPTLRSLNVSGNSLNVYVAAALAAALGRGHACKLEVLSMDATLDHHVHQERMGPHGCVALCRGVLAAKSTLRLTTLSLASQGILCRGAILLASVIPALPHLQILNLRENAIADEGAEALKTQATAPPRHDRHHHHVLQVCLVGNLLTPCAQARLASPSFLT